MVFGCILDANNYQIFKNGAPKASFEAKQRRFRGAFGIAFGVSGGRFWLIFKSLEVKFDGFRSQWGSNFSKHGG